MQDDQRHEGNQNLRPCVKHSVQDPGKNSEQSHHQEELAVPAERFSGKSRQHRIKADQCKSHSIFVKQDIVEHRIRSEQFQKFQQSGGCTAPAVLQKHKRGGKQERRRHCRGEDCRRDIAFYKGTFPEPPAFCPVPVPSDRSESRDGKVKTGETDHQETERKPSVLFPSDTQESCQQKRQIIHEHDLPVHMEETSRSQEEDASQPRSGGRDLFRPEPEKHEEYRTQICSQHVTDNDIYHRYLRQQASDQDVRP